ncbi:MAG: DNA translocase FtsK 4TM domain-containing protein, partial [Limnohabitans sp.]|nr:DNA translocase FtsK 4TM domain-containing protein [Limnohabitans sp.]
MTYSLHTLTNPTAPADAADEPRTFWARFAQEIGLLLGGTLLLLCILALWSYQPQDPAWSTSGAGPSVRNWMGRSGAWLADLAYFSFGYSVWWAVAAGVRAWLAGLAHWMRGESSGIYAHLSDWRRSRLTFWLGLAILLVASASLEWARLYRLDSFLPGHSGGALGRWVGSIGVQWLGFTGAALVCIALTVLGVAMVFRFSWGQMAENLGQRIDNLIQSRHVKREMQEDLALGQQALREREQAMPSQPVEPQWDMDRMVPAPEGQLDLAPMPVAAPKPEPMVIEPGVMDVPRSERVVKERQKPLFNDMPDSKLPQVDLLDALNVRQETVSPETLEMTSRLIEKKLKDFGVEVRVVAAAPGPVITRYEIEPATGVKGS